MKRGMKTEREMRMEQEVDGLKTRYSSVLKEIIRSMSETITQYLELRLRPCRTETMRCVSDDPQHTRRLVGQS